MYTIIVTQHDARDAVIGVDVWEEDKMPDPQELGDKVFAQFGECYCALATVNHEMVPFPIFAVFVEGLHFNGAQN